ncbi:K02A2.6-like [Cordylochernes scorpioides]|uniref:K02A2.6-like n=1 Tax=Cordylochernes scorpioides TaxID=51811 RepID=A0ABY6KH34_9ARAC|nr:K02A2.6-like [Cordylochernes scorpioides]
MEFNTLSIYDYSIEYRQGKGVRHADALIRIPLKSTENTTEEIPVMFINVDDMPPVSGEKIAEHSDNILKRVLQWALRGPTFRVDKEYSWHIPGVNLYKTSGLNKAVCVVWPAKPRIRLHIDYAGRIRGQMLLIVVDAFSKWPKAIAVQGMIVRELLWKPRRLFTTHGLPDIMVSVSASTFKRQEFDFF